jgi:hypothetical protein
MRGILCDFSSKIEMWTRKIPAWNVSPNPPCLEENFHIRVPIPRHGAKKIPMPEPDRDPVPATPNSDSQIQLAI